MDAFVMPSLYEGLGLAAVEAQAAGLPAFLSDQMPLEVDTGCGLVKFLSLQQSAKLWAKSILRRAEQASISQRDALVSVCRSRFELTQNLDSLRRLYSTR
jgi:glycosyltransferase EpsF